MQLTQLRRITPCFISIDRFSSIRNHIQQGSFICALLTYKQTRQEGFYNSSVVPLLLKACASLSFLHHVKALHAESIKAGSDCHVVIGTALLAAYAKCGVVRDARDVFDTMPERNFVTWNAMISGYLRNGDTESASLVFGEMQGKTQVSWSQMIGGFARIGDIVTARRLFDEVPREFKDVVTWTVMVDGYARIGEMEAAREVFEMMPERNCFVWSSMVCGYFKKGNVVEAEAVFDRVPVRNLEIWNSMIAGYVQNGFGEKALQAFEGMGAEGFEPDEFTVVSVLSACAQLGRLDVGKEIHHMVEQKGITVNPFVLSGLVDMYAKCGDLVSARLVFEGFTGRNIFCWNAMISGFAINGKFREVLEFFSRMEDSNVRPDGITFITVLSACAHGGLVSEALEVISKMEAYGVEVGIKHYGCLVDLLGRAGRLKDAYDLMIRMPVKPNDTVLGAMLGACRIHSDMNMAELVMKLIREDSATGADSHNVLLSNIYAASEKWEKAERMRRPVVDGGSQKTPGCSSIIFSDSYGLSEVVPR
ncbi:pentatricopeptide repeat-containing protein At3g21470 [Cajanus cajan]|uniref:Pentatricopeptide repeat-containing protein At3g21470 family n=1 Tax=Cajanus cajan TaxID=3821 RepID=A0A151TS99_CAJCA|nr:pentatricopeptide repeat-containing protein At3g21470 [Cajanus cajan]KYP69924.1 Pentatricopeptide repeat-containing protein At3g21470 family [Cajanus cajan]